MTQPVIVDGTRAWRKTYGRSRRHLRLAALRMLATRLDLPPLLPPPHRDGDAARRTEAARIRQLDAIGVTVPEILAEADGELVLTDLGPTLAVQLRQAEGESRKTDALVASAVEAIADAHRRGGYLSQAWPRNVTLSAGQVGFIDFEEDPGEVMSQQDAQARDWLLFAHGTMRYYRGRPRALAGQLSPALRDAQPDTVSGISDVGTRLQPLANGVDSLRREPGTLGQVLRVLRSALPVAVGALLLALGVDWVHDGQISLFDDLAGLF